MTNEEFVPLTDKDQFFTNLDVTIKQNWKIPADAVKRFAYYLLKELEEAEMEGRKADYTNALTCLHRVQT